jgi:hypothetical protein
MTDVTPIFDHYRVSARSIWNTAFWPDPEFREWDYVDEFTSIERILFDSLVLAKLDLTFAMDDIFRVPMPLFHVNPSSQTTPILIQCPRPGAPRGYWDDPVKEVSVGKVDMHFLTFFDWNQLDYRDFQYYRVQIAAFDEQPHLVGREALIERHSVRVMLADEPEA